MRSRKIGKVVILGTPCGKTTLLEKETSNIYRGDNITPTVGAALYTMHFTNDDDQNLAIDVWDTAGQEKFQSLLSIYIRGCQAIILAFDLSNKESLEALKKNIELCKQNFKSLPKIIFAGTKADLEHHVQEEDVERLAKECEITNYEYFETSAKKGEGVKEVFNSTKKAVFEATREDPEKQKKEELIAQLDKYINRIEKHTNNKNPSAIDFTHGFWFFKMSRAANRFGNYTLAKSLREKLKNNSNESIQQIFNDVKKLRVESVEKQLFQFPSLNFFKKHDRGINSDELNKIINKAKKLR